jgi:SAM-dependent methyltransferase
VGKSTNYRHRKLIEKPIVIYGASRGGAVVRERLAELGVAPEFFVDGDPEKQGADIDGLKALSPEEMIERYGCDGANIAVGSETFYFEIRDRLRGLGVPEENIIPYKLDAYLDSGCVLKPDDLSYMYEDCLYQSFPDNLSGKDALWKVIKEYEFKSVLDLGAGTGGHSRVFRDAGKEVTAIVAYGGGAFDATLRDAVNLIEADYTYYEFAEKFDLVWASHMLEHVRNIGMLLDKINRDLKDGGILVLTVPPSEPCAGGGHCNYFSPGHAICHLLEAGFDLSDMRLRQYGNNLSIICRKNARFEPHVGNFARSFAVFENRLPNYVNAAIERYRSEHIDERGVRHERIPINAAYKW